MSHDRSEDPGNSESARATHIGRRGFLGGAAAVATFPSAAMASYLPKFRKVKTQYIATRARPSERRGKGAQNWGFWSQDPGPRGVWVNRYDKLAASGGKAPAQWQFDEAEWWLDENGVLMEKPVFPIPAGRYLVTGNRTMMSVLTVKPMDETGDMAWRLNFGASIYDVTHLECRAGRYTPVGDVATCTPKDVDQSVFPIKPGTWMPAVPGCHMRDYAVLFVVGVEVTG